MKINIYYGGRGIIDDPTLFVIRRMEAVLEEVHVMVEKHMLYEEKNSIVTLSQTLKDADGVILATTVEWYGMGGYLQQFLDACWLYGDKKKIAQIYMCPVVMSTTFGEDRCRLDLEMAWEILGGISTRGISGYVADASELENNPSYTTMIEKAAENLYRTINQKLPAFPNSISVINQKVSSTRHINLTPQENEQLSQYVSDDSYVQKTKEDIKELASLFRDMMGAEKEGPDPEILKAFRSHFTPLPGFRGSYLIRVEGWKTPLFISVDQLEVEVNYVDRDRSDVEMQIGESNLRQITSGQITFQRAFMGGLLKSKGEFGMLRDLDQLFSFR